MRRLLLIVGLGLLGMPGCGRQHLQQNGHYTFQVGQVLRDDCQLLSMQPPLPLKGSDFITSGDIIRMQYDFFSMQMVGAYLSSVERFYADGSVANVTTQLPGGAECLLDLASVHLDGTTDDARHFHGGLRVSYQERNSTACVCELWFTYSASMP